LKDLFSKTILRVTPEGITSAKNGVLLFAQTKYVVFILDASIFFIVWPAAWKLIIPPVSGLFRVHGKQAKSGFVGVVPARRLTHQRSAGRQLIIDFFAKNLILYNSTGKAMALEFLSKWAFTGRSSPQPHLSRLVQ